MEVEESCIQACLSCCGDICINCGFLGGLCCCKCCCIYELQSSNGTYDFIKAGLVENFGKFKRMLKPGFNLINPCTEEVTEVSLKIKMVSVGKHKIITKDNVNLDI